MKLSIIIPVYNERKYFEEIIKRVLAVKLDKIEKEIIIIESNSTDGTRDLVKKCEGKPSFKIIYEPRPRGKGSAVKKGFKAATGDIILIQDADLEYKPEEYPELLKPILEGKAKFVLGSRHLGAGHWKIRRFNSSMWSSSMINVGSEMLALSFYLLYGVKLTDPQTMFKVFKRDCLDGIKFKSNYFELDWEIVIKLIKKGYIPLEVPVSYKSRTFKEGKKIKLFRDGILNLKAIFWYKFFD